MKLPLVTPLKSRNGTSNKDGRLTNVLAEQKPTGETVAQVRPGLTSIIASSGNGNGLVSFNDTLISVYGQTAYSGIGESSTWGQVGLTFPFNPLATTRVIYSGNVAIVMDYSNLSQKYRSSNGTTWNTVSQAAAPFSWWFAGSDLYTGDSTGVYFVKSTDYGDSFSTVSALPAAANFNFAYVGSTIYLYDLDNPIAYSSADGGVTWSSPLATSGLGALTNATDYFMDGIRLYLIDFPNGEFYYSDDYVNFTIGGFAGIGAGCSGGVLVGSTMYIHWINGVSGEIGTLSIGSLSSVPSYVATVPYMSGSGGSNGLEGGVFKIGASLYSFGGTGVYSSSPALSSIGTVTDSFFDFVQSTT